MCVYVLNENSPVRKCEIASYFKNAPKLTQPNEDILTFPSLPEDDEGYCIFHSKDINWKIKKKFHKWIDNLVKYLNWYDRVMFMMTHPQTLKVVDLAGVYLIGQEIKQQSGATETVLRFRSLHLSDHIEIKLDQATIVNKTVFEQCDIAQVEMSFNHAVINGELFFSNCVVGAISFNNTRLNSGLIMNNCKFNRYAEFSGMIVRNIFQIAKSQFQTHAFFTSTNFECETVFIENVHFHGKADFNMCNFHGDVEIQECHFEQLLNFSNAKFNGPVEFTANYYQDNVQFISSERENRVFYDNVHFTFIDRESEVQERIIFDNVNFFLIAGKDREELMELARYNKVTIGSGCIKYRVQTMPVTIATDHINKNIARELAQSFTNYFVGSTGKSLGVEFTDNSINKITLFYYTDEDITNEELFARLSKAEVSYWESGEPGPMDISPEETKRKIDNYISKIGILMKMTMLQNHQLMSESTVEEIIRAICFNDSENRAKQIQIIINHNHYQYMKIGKVIAQPNSQVNIAENIKKIEFRPFLENLSKEDLTNVKALLLDLDPQEVQELRDTLTIIPTGQEQWTIAERVSSKLNDLAVRHALPILDGIASSALFEFLKSVFFGS